MDVLRNVNLFNGGEACRKSGIEKEFTPLIAYLWLTLQQISKELIPKIIHQTWKTKELPLNLRPWHDEIQKLHPGWDINLWTDEDNLELVKKHFPFLQEIYCSLKYNIMRADVIRYIYMYVFGGYYLDLDYELFLPFSDEISNTELLLPISRERNNDGQMVIGNCIFGSAPKHPFWKDVLNELYTNPPLKRIYNKNKILKLTGPQFISKIYFKNPEKYKGSLISRKIFHPNNEMYKAANYREILLKSGSRGIHHCQGSWMATKNPLVYLITKINSKFI